MPHLCLVFFRWLVEAITHTFLYMRRVLINIKELNSWLDTS